MTVTPLSRPAPPLVEIRAASFAYDRTRVLTDVSLRVEKGELVGLLGPSGAGKTTLLRALLGDVRCRSGSVLLHGTPVSRRHRVGYVPQVGSVDWSFPVTVGEVVQMGLAGEAHVWPWPRRRDLVERRELLDRLGIGDLERRHIRELSGGQQQRVFLARALIRRPDLLLLDEPTSGVDAVTRRDVVALLREQHAAGVTVIVTTHDLNGVAANLPRLVALNGRVVADGSPSEVFTPRILRAVFGAEMIVLSHDDLLLTADLPVDHASHGHVHHGHVHHGSSHAGDLVLFDHEVS